MSETDEIKEPKRVVVYECPKCERLCRDYRVALWCCQVPLANDPRWDKVSQAAAEQGETP